MDYQTSRSMILDSIKADGLTPDRFPATMAALHKPRAIEWFKDELSRLRDTIEAGSIIKSRYADMRGSFGNLYDGAFRNGPADSSPSAAYLAIDRESRPEWFDDAYYAHGFQGMKRVRSACAKHKGDPLADMTLALLDEWDQIVAALDSIKANVTTTAAVREEKKIVAAKAKSAIPPSKLSAVVAAAVDAKKPDLADSYKAFVTSTYASMVKEFGPELKGIYKNRSYIKAYENTVRPLLGPDRHLNASALNLKANEYAEQVAEGMKDKIMQKAGELDNPQVKRMTGYDFQINGERFGKPVAIVQTMIVNVSKLGTLYNQFPARIFVSGRFMSEAAYKGMKE